MAAPKLDRDKFWVRKFRATISGLRKPDDWGSVVRFETAFQAGSIMDGVLEEGITPQRAESTVAVRDCAATRLQVRQ
jgi:hypothetical protein